MSLINKKGLKPPKKYFDQLSGEHSAWKLAQIHNSVAGILKMHHHCLLFWLVDTSLDSSCASPVVSLQLSPSRKSTRLHASVPIVTPSHVTPSHFQLSGRKEANILARVAHLQKEGKWLPGKKLGKLQPVQRPKTHWYYIIFLFSISKYAVLIQAEIRQVFLF